MKRASFTDCVSGVASTLRVLH